jgi:hypothetical protein
LIYAVTQNPYHPPTVKDAKHPHWEVYVWRAVIVLIGLSLAVIGTPCLGILVAPSVVLPREPGYDSALHDGTGVGMSADALARFVIGCGLALPFNLVFAGIFIFFAFRFIEPRNDRIRPKKVE